MSPFGILYPSAIMNILSVEMHNYATGGRLGVDYVKCYRKRKRDFR